MKTMFAIYDIKAQAYQEPICEVNAATAIRSFEVAVRNEQSQYHQYPDDFYLDEVGHFHPEDLKQPIHPHENPIRLTVARALLPLEEPFDWTEREAKSPSEQLEGYNKAVHERQMIREEN